jgi:hypothetical protein
LAIFALLGQQALHAASPGFGSTTPIGAQRGTEIEVQFNGDRLGDAQQIMLYEPGITVTHLEVAGPTAVKTKLAIAPDCRLGFHAMRIRTATGISNLRTFSIGALPETKEVEPNNDFAQPQKIALDTTVVGVADNEDVDYFLVDAKKGERITAEVEGLRLGNTFFDPYVSIIDSKRFELARSDDAALLRQDGICSIIAPADGQYVIQMRESAFAGNGACQYRLHVGRFPRPTAVYPAGGKLGEQLDVTWLGELTGPRVEKVVLPATPNAEFALFARDAAGIAPSGNAFRLSDFSNVLEAEPNEHAQANPFEAPMTLNGIIGQPGDVDCFKFSAKKGQTFDVRVFARSLGSPLDSVLNVARIGGAGVGGNDDSGSPDAYLRFTAPEDDVYVVSMTDHLRQGGADYIYRVEVTPVRPAVLTGLPERAQYVDVTLAIPQDNRVAAMISGSRVDFGGDLQLELKDLPAGVTAEILPMTANRSEVPVLFAAAAGTPLAGSLADIIARPTDANQKIEGHLRQRTSLIRGQNNVEVWSHFTSRAAVAVTQEAPFRIEIVQPKVPLVRDGAMDLKVVATRKEGFKAPIPIRMLYNPPGVGSSGSVVIPEGQNEAVIPLTANGGAEVNTFKIAVLAEPTVGDGPILTSSQLADLQISEPFVAFAFQSAAVEQGQQTDLVIKVEKKKDFEGVAKVEVLGLPNEVTSEPKEITKDTTELVFPVKTTKNSPAGKHKTVLCRAVMTANGEPITHTLGTGELRIDTPLPPKADAPATAPAPMPVAQAPPMEKRLSRLEQLRLERQKTEKK